MMTLPAAFDRGASSTQSPSSSFAGKHLISYIHMQIYIYIYIQICINKSTNKQIHTDRQTDTQKDRHMCVYICMYIYIYIYIYSIAQHSIAQHSIALNSMWRIENKRDTYIARTYTVVQYQYVCSNCNNILYSSYMYVIVRYINVTHIVHIAYTRHKMS